MTKALIIGFGSIGKKHAEALAGLNCHIAVVSQNYEEGHYKKYNNIQDAVFNWKPDYCLITNETYKHFEAFQCLVGLNYKGILFIEKPLFENEKKIINNEFKKIFVGYQFRVHPIIQHLKNSLLCEKVISVQCYVGQHLPDWRTDRDYRSLYSSNKKYGGGVIRDLSHELDYMLYLFGAWKRLTAIVGKFSNLEISCEDVACLLVAFEKCPVATIQMNYVDKIKRREIIVNTTDNSYKADLITGTLESNQTQSALLFKQINIYQRLHESILNDQCDNITTLNQGIDVLRMIDKIESSSNSGLWIQN